MERKTKEAGDMCEAGTNLRAKEKEMGQITHVLIYYHLILSR